MPASPSAPLHRLGRYTHDHHRGILFSALLVLVSSVGMLLEGGRLTAPTIAGLESDAAQRLVDGVRGFPLETTFVVLFQSPTEDPDDFAEVMGAALDRARKIEGVARVITADDLPPSVELLMTNGEAKAAMAYVTMAGSLSEARRRYPAVRAAMQTPGLNVLCTGHVPYVADLDETLARDLLLAELLSLPLALLVLVLVFRTVIAAILPVLVGAVSVLAAIASVLLISHRYEMAQYTVNVCSLIGLGVSIDYSLFIVSRYREELATGVDRAEALGRTMATAGRIVMFSGFAAASGLCGLLAFGGSYLEAMGIGGVLVVVLAVIGALTVLPALLAALGPRIRSHPRRAIEGGFWSRLVRAVMKRPLAVLLPTLLVLLVMGTPFMRLHLAAADVRVLPADVEARQGHALLLEAFPEIGATRIAVAVDFPSAPAITSTRAAALFDLAARIRNVPHVLRVESVVAPILAGTREAAARELVSPSPAFAGAIAELTSLLVKDRTVVVYAVTDRAPETEEARQIVRKIRETRGVADGNLLVGGSIAHDLDTTEFIVGHAPTAVTIVVIATLASLFLLLGSVVLPIKALLMNFLSIAGSFGALVWVFQDGHLWVTEPRPVEPTLPVLLFCALFGLSMDYEVLMLGRIKEVYLRCRDNTQAVAEGLERTAGLITSAAAIMVAVFGAFALGRVVLIQAVGFGMALAVALDATLIRVLLVPATMRLFGDLNWWLPRPLARLRRALGFE